MGCCVKTITGARLAAGTVSGRPRRMLPEFGGPRAEIDTNATASELREGSSLLAQAGRRTCHPICQSGMFTLLRRDRKGMRHIDHPTSMHYCTLL